MSSETAWLHPVEPETDTDGAARLARLAGWALVAGVAGAAAWAVVVLLSREVNETDLRVILTSLGFAAASTTGASGVAAIMRDSRGFRALGVATLGCSIAAFTLFTWRRYRSPSAPSTPVERSFRSPESSMRSTIRGPGFSARCWCC